MKQYFFLAAIAAVTLGSCTNEEIGERSILPNEDGRTPIAITTYLQQTTRGYNAQEATASALTGSGGGFNLLAVTADATSPETIVDNWTFVVSNTESGACSPANTSLMPYWPSDKDQKVNFYASYPAGGASASANCTPDSETGTLAITTDGTIDILAAYTSASKADNNGSISLQFRHVLAQTIISVKGNTTGLPTGTAYSLKSLSLSAPNQATYTFSSGEVVANADAVETYDFHNATSDEAISLSSSAQTIGTAMVAASTGTGTTVQITAVYTATINGDTRTYERTGEATLVAGYKNQVSVSVTGDMPLTINAVVENMEPIVDGHVYVDLGLPNGLLWATMNVGASKPEEYGDYFAWGETESKEDYSWQTYKYCNGTQETLTKYVPQEMAESFGYEGYYDTLSVLELADDAAHINWGGGWKTPSDAEWQEIFNACTYEAINEDGVIGAKLISSYNGKSIFFPFAGFKTGTNWQEETLESYYWGTGVRRNWPVNVSQAVFQNGSTYVTTVSRNIGLPVRAVHPAE